MSGITRGVRSIRRAAGIAASSIVLVAAATAPFGSGRVVFVEGASAPTKAGAAGLAWHRIPSMHTARYDAGAEWSRQSILVIGGFDPKGAALRSVESYDLDYNRWTAAPPMPTARGDFGIFTYGSNTPITVLGGADSHGNPLKVVEQYDPPGMGQHPDQWSRLPPMPQARRGPAAAPDGGIGPIVAGGIGPGGKILNAVMELVENRPKPGDYSWRPVAPMHMRRYDFALVVGGNQNNSSWRVYAIGGFGAGHTPLRSTEAYNPRTNRWTMMAPMPTARGGLAAQAVDNGRQIILAGGIDSRGRALTTTEQYNVASNTWTTQPPMPVARSGLALVDTEGTTQPGLFVLGGRGVNGAVLASAAAREATLPKGWSLEEPLPARLADVVAVRASTGMIYAFGTGGKVDVFEPSPNRWSVRAPLPASLAPGGGATVVAGPDGMIYVLVGATFEAYDPATNRWTQRAPPPVDRSDPAAVTGKDGKIYLLGGSRPDPAESDNLLYPRGLDVYDPRTNTWQVKAPMPTAREGLGAAVGTDGTIYAIGGGTYHYKAAKCVSVVEAYNPATNTWTRTTALPKPACAVIAGSTSSRTIDAVAGAALQGGDGGSLIVPTTGTVLAFKPGANRWTTISRTPFPRKGAGTVVEPNGTVYVIGGADGFGDATATVQKCARCSPG